MEHNIKMLDAIPVAVLEKAEQEIARIHKGGCLESGWKKIKRCRGMLRFEITPKYWMVVESNRLREGPYVFMKHDTFDGRF